MMKKLFCLFFLLMPCLSLSAQNNIKMVTYFPVPYVSYLDLNVTGTCDLGLLDTCRLSIAKDWTFSSEATQGGLESNAIIVKKGSLSLNSSNPSSAIQGRVLQVGRPAAQENSLLQITDSLLVKKSLLQNGIFSHIQAEQVYLKKLFLGGYEFPVCSSATGNEIRWKKLTIDGTTGVFLTCDEN
ncbi:hypothetical protein [Candidatus Avelusimicrobium sp.]